MRALASFIPIVIPVLVWWPAPDKETTDDLIRKLGSPRFRVRIAATKRLLKKGPTAIPALQKAMRSPDPEVALRASHILKQLEQRPLNRAKRFIKDGKFDLATEILSRWPKGKYEDHCWQVACHMPALLSKEYKKPKYGIGIQRVQSPWHHKKPRFLEFFRRPRLITPA